MAGRAAGKSRACRRSAHDAGTGAGAATSKQYQAAAQLGRKLIRAAKGQARTNKERIK